MNKDQMGKKGEGGGGGGRERRSRRTKRSRSQPFIIHGLLTVSQPFIIYGLLTVSHSKSNKQWGKYEGIRTNRLNDTNE